MTPRERLIRRINQRGSIRDPNTPRPLVTLEEFFQGNDDPTSIGDDLGSQFGPAIFYDTFLRIRDRSDVIDVLVEILDHAQVDRWPTANTIWVITSASPREVQVWMGELYGTDIHNGWTNHLRREFYEVPPNMRALGIRWD